MNAVIIRTFIPTITHIDNIGESFGTHFLAPLITQNYAPVIACYGDSGSGKSLFGRAAISKLPAFFSAHSPNIKRPSTDGDAIDSVCEEGAFRYRDFGPETVNPFETRQMSDTFDLVLRQEISIKDPRYLRGLDLLEHPPTPHLNGADAILIIGRNPSRNNPLHSSKYFAKMEDMIAGREISSGSEIKPPFDCNNPRTTEILREIRRMKSWVATPHNFVNQPLGAAVIILSNSRPSFKHAFETFLTSLALP